MKTTTTSFPLLLISFLYNLEKDGYICPMGQQMDFIGNYPRKTSAGF